jgi:CelD/BcsL family acetyltransferase involved in cellulose biosynthesis
VTTETITTGEGFAALRDEWDGLVLAMPRPSPFLLHAWIAAWWRQAEGEGWKLRVHVARRDGRLVAALPLAVRRKGALRVAQFAGGHLSALADLMLAPDAGSDEAGGLLQLAADGDHDHVDVFGLPANSNLARAAGSSLKLIPRAESPVLELDRGWETVYQERTAAKRRNLHRRRRRQLGELGELEIVVARAPSEVEPALDEALRLHALRREGRPDASEFSSRPRGGFQRDALLALAADDRTRIVTMRLDGRAIAYHCYLWLARTVYVHSLAFDPEHGRLSPGQVTTLETIAIAAGEGAQRVEFLGGAERYKVELADRIEPMHEGLGLAHGVAGRIGVAAGAGSIAVRLRAKRSPALQRLYVDGLAPMRRVRARVGASGG